MQEEDIRFEEIGKDDTAHAEEASALFKQPIRGVYKNLHAELKARCAPENFMNPYEPDKVSMANELYSQVLSANVNDDATLKALRLKAMEELGVRFSTEQLYKKLTDACNPKNFTGENYNKERLDLANRLYQAVLMNADNSRKSFIWSNISWKRMKRQIDERGYAQKYAHDGRPIVKVGLAFSSEERNITEWKSEKA